MIEYVICHDTNCTQNANAIMNNDSDCSMYYKASRSEWENSIGRFREYVGRNRMPWQASKERGKLVENYMVSTKWPQGTPKVHAQKSSYI